MPVNNQIPIYSISRLDLANECLYAYYRRYILGHKSQDNIYNLTGNVLHDTIEKLCKNIKVDSKEELDAILEKCQILDINFINENVKTKWINNITEFIKNYEVPQYKRVINEVAFLYVLSLLNDERFVTGKIDFAGENEDGTYDLLDWKSSSKFSKSDLLEKGRQLIIYKLAWEFITGKKVNRVGWYMMKYVYVCSTLKNGNTKEKICERAYWVKDCAGNITTDLKKLNYNEIDIEVLLEEAIQNNSLNGMPQEIKDKYWTKPCIIWYDITDELENECKAYVIETAKLIESKDTNVESDWTPKQIDRSNAFYCQELSGFRSTCPYLKTYLDEMNSLIEEVEEHDDILD